MTKTEPTWLQKMSGYTVYALLRLLSLLPYGVKLWLGEKIGIMLHFFKVRRKVVEANIRMCYPNWTELERRRLVKQNYIYTAQGALETIHAWWCNIDDILANVQVEGLDIFQKAQNEDRGVLLMSGHFTIFDMMLPIASQYSHKPTSYVYRANDNPIINQMIEEGRAGRFQLKNFDKKQIKSFMRFIRQNGVGWYGCDQDFKQYVDLFVPFFGVQAGCISMPTNVGKISKCPVVFYSCARIGYKKYLVRFDDLGMFGDDPQSDAVAWNAALERAVRRHPAQYLWMHKRFKTRPEGEPKIY